MLNVRYIMKFDRIALKITFFLFISGLVLISNVAISQTPNVMSWTQSEAYSDPGTYEEIEINDAEKKKFTVTLTGTHLNNSIKLKFALAKGGGPTGTKIVDPVLSEHDTSDGYTKAVYEVNAGTVYEGARYEYVPYNGVCHPKDEDLGNGLCRGTGSLVAGPGKHTLSATLVNPGNITVSASWNFWIVDTGTPNPPVTQQPPVRNNPPVTQQPPQQQPTDTQQPVQQNNAPAFTDGSTTTRSVAENTASGIKHRQLPSLQRMTQNNDTLTYTLGGTDAAAFSIVSTSGQLRTSAALDYETKTSYSVTVTVSDGNAGSDSITVTINITDVDETVVQQPPPPSGEGTQQSPPPSEPDPQTSCSTAFTDGAVNAATTVFRT